LLGLPYIFGINEAIHFKFDRHVDYVEYYRANKLPPMGRDPIRVT